MSWYRAEMANFGASRAARWYGIALSGTVLLAARFWWNTAELLADGALGRIPRPGLEWIPVPEAGIGSFDAWLGGMALAALAAAAAFGRKWDRSALALLALATAMKAAYFSLDLRLMGNYHMMPLLASLAYLLFPSRLRLQQCLLVLFYLAAGALKLGPEWLSGAAIPPSWLGATLYRALFFEHPRILLLGTHWVVFLELFFVLWLLHPSRGLRNFAFAQVVLFHAFSYFAVGYFYPLIMACLLAVFPLSWMGSGGESAARVGMGGWVFLGAFAFCQILPWTAGRDPALARERTLLALNMFDARPDCTSTTVVRQPGRTLDLTFDPDRLAARILCEPSIYLRRALELCGELGPGAKLDLQLQSRRRTETSFHTWIDTRDLCRNPPRIEVWGRNAWLLD
jgi:hypothetical protein